MDPGTAALLIAPWPAVQVKTWKMALGEVPGTLSTKATFVPSKERTGEVEILPPVTVVMLYANSTFGAVPLQNPVPLLLPYILLSATRLAGPPLAPGTR